MTQEIDRSTYIEADEKTTKALTFDMLNNIYSRIDTQIESCNKRFEKLENKRRRDTASSTMFGFVGGFVAVGLKWVKDLF